MEKIHLYLPRTMCGVWAEVHTIRMDTHTNTAVNGCPTMMSTMTQTLTCWLCGILVSCTFKLVHAQAKGPGWAQLMGWGGVGGGGDRTLYATASSIQSSPTRVLVLFLVSQQQDYLFTSFVCLFGQLSSFIMASSTVGLHMSPNNICYVARHFLFFPYVPMSLFIRPWRHFLQFLF